MSTSVALRVSVLLFGCCVGERVLESGGGVGAVFWGGELCLGGGGSCGGYLLLVLVGGFGKWINY